MAGWQEIHLDGQVAIVTGAASGLGLETVRLLASHGARVVLADVNTERVQALATELREGGADAVALTVDVASPQSVGDGVASVLDDLGRIDVLINAAGVDVTASATDLTPEDWRRVLGVNEHDGRTYLNREALEVFLDGMMWLGLLEEPDAAGVTALGDARTLIAEAAAKAGYDVAVLKRRLEGGVD